MYRLRLLLRGGHFVDALISTALTDAYEADPGTFGDHVWKVLAEHSLYVVDVPGRGHGYVLSSQVVAWEVLEDQDL